MEPTSATAPTLYGLDIETDTTIDGLDPLRSSVVAAALSTDEGDVVFQGSERSILTGLDDHLGGLEPGTIVTWNGARFDLPFLAVRAGRLGIPLGLRLFDRGSPYRPWPPPATPPPPASMLPGSPPPDRIDRFAPAWLRARWGPHGHLDGYRLFRGDVRRTTGLSCGLKALARLLGLDAIEVDAAALHELAPEEVAAYVASDARLARQLVLRRMPAAHLAVDAAPA